MWKIAIFDDNQIVVDALCRSINWKELNCGICGVALNGTDALSVINNTSPDIVITDITMPGFSGLELAAMSRAAHFPTLFIIILLRQEHGGSELCVRHVPSVDGANPGPVLYVPEIYRQRHHRRRSKRMKGAFTWY